MKRERWRSTTVLVAVVLLLMASGALGQVNKAVWSVKHLERGSTLTSVYSVTLLGGWNDNRYVQWLWAGDESGMVRLVLDPDADGFLKINKVPVTAQPSKPPARPPASVPINDIYFHDPKHGLLLRGNGIYLSSSGGLDWLLGLTVPARDGAVAVLNSLDFFPGEPERGCVVGTYRRDQYITDSLVLCSGKNSRDGLQSWRVPIQLPSRTELYHLNLVDDRHGWIVGAAGMLLYTDDGGETWSPQDSKTRAALFHVNFTDSKHGWAVGESNTVLRTTNGGKDWQQSDVPTPADTTLMSVKFVNAKEGWAVGYKGVILYSHDGGVKWVTQDSRTKEDLYALDVDDKYCWAVGSGGVILRYLRRSEP